MGALVLEAALILLQIVFFAAAAVFLLHILAWAISGYLDVPFVPTPPRYAQSVTSALSLRPGDIVYELGSGDGRFLLACAALEPGARFIGIERNPLLHLAALARKRLAGNLPNAEFRRGDLFKTDLSDATKIYVYLLDSVMERLRPKFERQFRGTLASRAFPLARKDLSNVVLLTEAIGAHGQHLLFVYDFGAAPSVKFFEAEDRTCRRPWPP